ncbi:aqualysin-1-like [Diadema antillarum]|uniref:aqualysin-1-like n=1 Tax=Diadema antillarum TaxID=105358 RepID=UPI003A85F31F
MTELDNKALSEVRNMEGVEYVEEDGVVSQEAVLVTEDRTFENDVANWGLDRIDQRSNRLDGKFFINGSGNGVHVYILDSGLRPTHKDIAGRAHVAYDAYGGSGFDIDGHGTHCAGIVAGTEYGVAKKANVYGIRIIRGHHKGSVSGVIRGLNWVKLNRKRPCVASMSISGTASKTLNRSARELFNSGCVLVAAASNSNTDSCTRSPAQMPEVITVAASDRNDFRTSFSDYGDCVDLFAPGSHILSLDYKSDDATIPLSGTSMATPFVSGAAAILLEKGYPYNEVARRLRELSTKGVIQHKGYHTPNRLLYLD